MYVVDEVLPFLFGQNPSDPVLGTFLGRHSRSLRFLTGAGTRHVHQGNTLLLIIPVLRTSGAGESNVARKAPQSTRLGHLVGDGERIVLLLR